MSPNLQTCEQRSGHRKSMFTATQARINEQPGVARGFCGGVCLVCVKGGEETEGVKDKRKH